MGAKKIKFNIDDVELYVNMDIDSLINELKEQFDEWDRDSFTRLWSIQYGDVIKADYESDLNTTIKLLESIRINPGLLKEGVEEIDKKESGEFWKRAGYTMKSLDNVSNYVTDFTNSWSVLQLRLSVIDDNTCELILQDRLVSLWEDSLYEFIVRYLKMVIDIFKF